MADQWGWPLALAVAGVVALFGAVLWLKIDLAERFEARG
jgi:hypothetical protein